MHILDQLSEYKRLERLYLNPALIVTAFLCAITVICVVVREIDAAYVAMNAAMGVAFVALFAWAYAIYWAFVKRR